MKACIIGAGCQGSACASILCKDTRVESVLLSDINKKTLESVSKKINSPKLKTVIVNASHTEDIIRIAGDSDVIFDMTLPWLAKNVMKAALAVHAHYVNTAFDDPFWDQLIHGQTLDLDKEFKTAGLTALLGCGNTPGLSNVFIKYYCDRLDTVSGIKIRGGGKFSNSKTLIKPWYPGWAPNQALIDFCSDTYVFRNGTYERAGIFAEPESFDFGPHLHHIWVAHHSHEEIYTLPNTIGKGLTCCDFKYAIDEQAATFICMGFTPDNEIEINGRKIKPFDVLMALTKKPGDDFLTEEPPKDNHLEWLYETCFIIDGTKNGNPVSYRVLLPPIALNALACYEACGTLGVSVALPAVIGGLMCLEGAQRGILFPELLDSHRFIDLLKEKVPYQQIDLS